MIDPGVTEGRGDHRTHPYDFSWALALHEAGLGDVQNSVASLPGNVCTDGNKQPRHNTDRRVLFNLVELPSWGSVAVDSSVVAFPQSSPRGETSEMDLQIRILPCSLPSCVMTSSELCKGFGHYFLVCTMNIIAPASQSRWGMLDNLSKGPSTASGTG